MAQQFDEQIRFLYDSCEAYDRGVLREAKRIAGALRVLLHDCGPAKSLIGQLGMLDVLFFDTTPYVPPGVTILSPIFNLVAVRLDQAPPYRFVSRASDPLLITDTWMLPFERWWAQDVVVGLPGQLSFTRSALVLAMANEDGGAHVDPALSDSYYRITRENGLGVMMKTPAGEIPIREVASASVRTIGHEAMVSLFTPYREIPRDLPDPEWRPTPTIVSSPRGNVSKQAPILGCPCKSGNAYKECHGSPC